MVHQRRLQGHSIMLGAALSLAALVACADDATRGPLPRAAKEPDHYEKNQVYWREGDQAALPIATDCKTRLSEYLALRRSGPTPAGEEPWEYRQPELMALGDSLYNGVQSMRINWFLSEWSAPTSVAIGLGLVEERRADRNGVRRFYNPQYPTHGKTPYETQDYGFNLESLPRGIFRTIMAPRLQAEPLHHLAFEYLPANQRAMVDNLAFSGANSHDLLFWTARDHRIQAERYVAAMRADTGGLPARFGNLNSAFFHANAAFVLNPMRDECLYDLTPIDHVVLRKPKRLIVQIGPNDGMWMLAVAGARASRATCSAAEMATVSGTTGRSRCASASIDDSLRVHYIRNVKALIDRLAPVAEVRDVYLNNLPFPSRTGNLVPDLGDGSELRWYSDLMSGADNKISFPGARIKASDRLIEEVNAKVVEVLAEANRARSRRGWGPLFHVVDVNAQLGSYDAKGCDAGRDFRRNVSFDSRNAEAVADCKFRHSLPLDARRFGLPESVRFDNRPVRLRGDEIKRENLSYETRVKEGGLFSFDNMHLSSVGYEIMARAVIAEMRRNGETKRPGRDDGTVDRCKKPGDPGYEDMVVGDCARLLTTPGWVYADATRRTHVFLRRAGLEETRNADRLSARIAFVMRLMNRGEDEARELLDDRQ